MRTYPVTCGLWLAVIKIGDFLIWMFCAPGHHVGGTAEAISFSGPRWRSTARACYAATCGHGNEPSGWVRRARHGGDHEADYGWRALARQSARGPVRAGPPAGGPHRALGRRGLPAGLAADP